MENVFDILCSALVEPEIKELFMKEEGADLMVLIMKWVTSRPIIHLLFHSHCRFTEKKGNPILEQLRL